MASVTTDDGRRRAANGVSAGTLTIDGARGGIPAELRISEEHLSEAGGDLHIATVNLENDLVLRLPPGADFAGQHVTVVNQTGGVDPYPKLTLRPAAGETVLGGFGGNEYGWELPSTASPTALRLWSNNGKWWALAGDVGWTGPLAE